MAAIEAIDSFYVQVDVSSVTFTVPTGYQHLQLVASMRDSETGNWGTLDQVFNSENGAHYSHNFMYWYGTYEARASDINAAEARAYGMAVSDKAPWVPQQVYGATVVTIPDYAHTTKNTSWHYFGGNGIGVTVDTTGTTAVWGAFAAIGGGALDNQASQPHSGLTTLKLRGDSGSLVRGFEATLYGLKSS